MLSGHVYHFNKSIFDTANPSVMALDSIRSISMANSIFDFTHHANQDPLTHLKVKSE